MFRPSVRRIFPTHNLFNYFKIIKKDGSYKLCLNNYFKIIQRYSSSDVNTPYVSHPYSYAFGRSDQQLLYESIGQRLEVNAKKESVRPAIISQHENLSKTLSQFNNDVDKLVKGMKEKLSLKNGDVVGIWSCNNYSWIVIQHACFKLGVIVCTINPVYKHIELDHVIRKGQIKAIFMPGFGSQQEQVNNYMEILHQVIKSKNQSKNQDNIILKQIVLIDGNNDKNFDEIEVHEYESLIKNDGIYDKTSMELICPDDPAMIMFTSGTTGKPKGALQSHFTLLNNTVLTSKKIHEDLSNAIICNPLPLFHTFAGVLGAISMSCVPISMILTGLRYNVKSIVDSISQHDCTFIMATPTIMIDVINYVEKNNIQLPSLVGACLGGSPVPVEIAHRITKIIPSCTDVRIGYGATEFGPCSTASIPSSTLKQKIETVGTPLDFVEVKIVDPSTGKIRKIGENGELLVRGHTVLLGYWRDEEKTKESFADNKWFKSGDLAVMDERGFVKIIGRTKEMIIRGGENIYPREVEEVLHLHPNIFDAYVVGLPDKRMGEEVCVWIKLKNKDLKMTEEDVKEFCKDKLSYFKIPRYVIFVDEFPLTPTGKAKKHVMREESCKILNIQE